MAKLRRLIFRQLFYYHALQLQSWTRQRAIPYTNTNVSRQISTTTVNKKSTFNTHTRFNSAKMQSFSAQTAHTNRKDGEKKKLHFN